MLQLILKWGETRVKVPEKKDDGKGQIKFSQSVSYSLISSHFEASPPPFLHRQSGQKLLIYFFLHLHNKSLTDVLFLKRKLRIQKGDHGVFLRGRY